MLVIQSEKEERARNQCRRYSPEYRNAVAREIQTSKKDHPVEPRSKPSNRSEMIAKSREWVHVCRVVVGMLP